MVLSNFSAACRDSGGVRASGNSGHFTLTHYTSTGSYFTSTGGGWYVDVGFGDTTVDVDDYKLDDSNSMDNSSILTFISSSVWNLSPYLKWVCTYYKNNTSNPITVKEIGIFAKDNGTSHGSNLNSNFMIARKVLDTPVTIQPGCIESFSYGIDIAS